MLARRWLTRLNRAEEKAGPQDIGDARVGYRFSVFTWAVPVVHRSGDRRHSSVWILAGLLARALGVQIPKVLARSKLHIDRSGQPDAPGAPRLCAGSDKPRTCPWKNDANGLNVVACALERFAVMNNLKLGSR